MNFTLNDEKVSQIAAEAVAKYKVEDAKRLVNRFTPGHDAVTKYVKPSGFDSFGEYLSAVQKADKGRGEDARLKALNISEPSAGGWLVPVEYKTQLMAASLEDAFFWQRASVIPMSTDECHIPRIADTSHASNLFGGVTCYWKGEATALSESEPTFGSLTLSCKKLTGYTLISNELLADSQPAAETLLSKMFGGAMAWYLEDAFINGDGAGKPLGVMNSPALITVTAETGQGASTIVAENIFKMYSRLLPSSTKRAVWLASPDVKPQLYSMGIAVGAGGGIVYTPMGGLSAAPYDTLMGLPVIFTEKCPKLGTAGDLILADLSYYLIGDRTDGLRMDSTMHLKFAEDQTAFRFIQRVDGMPWLASPITPANGGDPLSAFICLNSTRT
jgi:HK97 family phage major capsid protein